jgi:hypothetical protein
LDVQKTLRERCLTATRSRDKAHEEEPKFPFNIRFIAGNFLELELKRRYDVIIWYR